VTESLRRRIIQSALIVLAAVVFVVGINWGLPTRGVDPYLFGEHPVWSGRTILRLAGGWDTNSKLGSDVDLNPITRRSAIVTLNANDIQRAEIIRRYRLFSAQPDEMITMRALAQMKPAEGKLDPKLYQYGGLWIYPVGALLKGASRIGAIELTSDLTFYLDHPEAFGRFYIVARLYSALWGLAGVWAVFWLVRRISSGLVAPATAAVCYIFMPVVINMAHEAKPHLPGAVLALLAAVAATKCADTRRRRWAALAGALCGAATGMVLSGVLSFIILPVMALASAIGWRRRFGLLALAIVVGAAVYAASNPYVIGHLLRDHTVLQSNLQNSTAMYQAPASARGIRNGIMLIGGGASPLIACFGAIAACIAIRRWRNAAGWILLAACGIVVIQFLALATNKPGEYGRFAVLPDVGLAIAAVAGICGWIRRPFPRSVALAVLVLSVIPCGLAYEWQFMRDSRHPQTRLIAAARLAALSADIGTIVLPAEPAPYDLPPVNLFDRKLILPPRAGVAIRDPWLSVRPVDRVPRTPVMLDGDAVEYLVTPPPIPTPISWAGKSFELVAHPAGAPGGGGLSEEAGSIDLPRAGG
jgi:hypothetical protein